MFQWSVWLLLKLFWWTTDRCVRRIAKYNAIFQFLILVDSSNPTNCSGAAVNFLIRAHSSFLRRRGNESTRQRKENELRTDVGNMADMKQLDILRDGVRALAADCLVYTRHSTNDVRPNHGEKNNSCSIAPGFRMTTSWIVAIWCFSARLALTHISGGGMMSCPLEKFWTSMLVLLVGESRPVCRRDRQTDGRTPDRYITLSAMDATSKISINPQNMIHSFFLKPRSMHR